MSPQDRPSDWRVCEDWYTLSQITGPTWPQPKDTACDCDDCIRLKRAARQIDDITWWTGDEGAEAVAKAQKAVWEARKKLHGLHFADRTRFQLTGQHIYGISEECKYIRSEEEYRDGDEEVN